MALRRNGGEHRVREVAAMPMVRSRWPERGRWRRNRRRRSLRPAAMFLEFRRAGEVGKKWVVAACCGREGAPGAHLYRGGGGREEEIGRAGVTAAMARPLAIRQSRAREKGKRTGAEAA